MLKRLAEKAQIELNGKRLSFHCFRKMFLSASIDSGIGLTAGKLMCGKAVPKSDSTYLTSVKLRELFIQLNRFLSINEQPQIETEKIASLKKAVNELQEELVVQKTITETVAEENLKLRSKMEALSRGQSALEEKVDEMATMFRMTFADAVKASAVTIFGQKDKVEAKAKEEKRTSQKSEERKVTKT
jgi:hypothetical protein